MRCWTFLLLLAVPAIFPLRLEADPCGDVNVDSFVDGVDVAIYRGFLADPGGMPLSPAGEDNCTVVGPPRPCDVLDVVVLRRVLALPPLPPAIAAVCASSLAGCEVLNAVECLLPYPSTHYTTAAAAPTGLRLNLTQAGLPVVIGEPISTAPFNELDGFSPMVPIMMHFPQGVDLVLSNTSRLLPPMAGGPPWVDTRTHDGRSLDPDSPSVLLDADTGARILHWLELDARANGNPARQALVMRPARSLTPGHRYIVAMRDLTAPGGVPVVAEPPFLALRDAMITANPAIEERRPYMEANIFPVLVANGITRADLVLAFDFVVQSEQQLTHQMLEMRDQAFAYTAALDADPLMTGFTVNSTLENACLPGETVWREVSGTFQSPLFLTALPGFNFPELNVDASDVPVQNGFMAAPFSISIPCSVLDPMGPVSRPIVLGHGLFGTGASMMGVPPAAGQVTQWTYIAGATDFRGLSSEDFTWVGLGIIGFGSSGLHHYPAFVDRLRQGMLNTLVLAKLMKLGIFNRDPAFQTPTGPGVFPGPSEEMYYYGISLGGIMGTWLAALTPDVERFGLDVPAINFSCLLQRSTQFGLGSPFSFEDLLQSIGITDPLKTMLGLHVLGELWVSGEPAGYALHVTSDPLPGSGSPAKILMTPAWLDKQVSNQCTEIAARTLGLVSHEGSLQQGLQGIPDTVGPQDSALVMYDTGSFDLFNPLHAPFIPPLSNEIPSPVCDPHGARPSIPAGILQLVTFLQPGGQIHSFCSGVCDAGTILEQPPTPCDPLN